MANRERGEDVEETRNFWDSAAADWDIQVGDEGDDVALIGLLKPLQDDGGVKAARVREHNLLEIPSHDGLLPAGNG